MKHTDVLAVAWRISSHSTSGNQCVEVGAIPGADTIAVRDSKNRTGGTHLISRTAWTALIHAIKHDRL
jgi:hypothetical protein